MGLLKRFTCSSVGAKQVIALTGLMLSGFVVMHLSGNLLIFAGREVFNSYAEKLASLGALLWAARLGLLGAFVVHISLALSLAKKNRQARPVSYQKEATVRATFASRYMVLTGLCLLFFILFHLSHYTFRILNPEFAALGPFQVYEMVTMGFKNIAISFFYICSMVALGFHLCHGLSSIPQSWGINHPNINCFLRALGPVLATILSVAYISIPVAVLLGFIN